MKCVKKVYMDKPETIVLLMDKKLLNLDKDLLMCFTYIPPEKATYYTNKQEPNGINQLETELVDLLSRHRDTHLLIAGDLNARTGSKQDFISEDNLIHVDFNEFYPQDIFKTPRFSRDTETNKFGESLIDLCCSLGIHMLNGRYGDTAGEFTSLPAMGKSVVDYIILDTMLHSIVTEFSVPPMAESDHQPVTCKLRGVELQQIKEKNNKWTQCKWKTEKRDDFILRLTDNTGTELIENVHINIQHGNIEGATGGITDLLTYAAANMKSKAWRKSEQPRWWDTECDVKKCKKMQDLRKFRTTRSEGDLQIYKASQKTFRNTCAAKEKLYKQEQREKLRELHTPRDMWRCIRNITRDKISHGNIDTEDWFAHFDWLSNSNKIAISEDFEEEVHSYLHNHDEHCNMCTDPHSHYDVCLNNDITYFEVKSALEDMKNGKSPGPDGIVVEIYKNVPENILLPLLLELYNSILKTGKFPSRWCNAIICPLYKGKGSVQDLNSYRGISLTNVISKVFTKILNVRLNNYVTNYGLLRREQIGYRRGFCTVDHLFSLQAVAQKYLTRKSGRLYILYVDFSKAFDCIQHDLLWYVMLNNGFHGYYINVIRDMYKNMSSCVRTSSDELSDYFKSEVGTWQGCMLSPSLFTQFLNEYSKLLDREGCNGVFISEELPNLLALMYADDIGNMADTVGRLQQILNKLALFCKQFGMKVNMEKTQVMVLRNGGPLRRNEKWFYNDCRVKTTSHYDYLGLSISCLMKWAKATNNLAKKGLKAMNVIRIFVNRFDCTDTRVLFSLFDKMVVPIIMYGAEVWGTEYRHCIERVQLKFCKYVLGVGSQAPDVTVLGECGRYPMFVLYYTKVIKYWCRLLCMSDETISKQCYIMLKKLDESKRYNWVTDVKGILSKYGFAFVWHAQEIGDNDAFVEIFTQRIKDCAYQEWHSNVEASPKLTYYAEFKTLLNVERYLLVIPQVHLRKCMARFRCSTHSLAIETGRHMKIDRKDRLCTYCCLHDMYAVEDEFHFLIKCPLYSDLRDQYIPNAYSHNCMFALLSSQSDVILLNVCKYVYESFKRRQTFLHI